MNHKPYSLWNHYILYSCSQRTQVPLMEIIIAIYHYRNIVFVNQVVALFFLYAGYAACLYKPLSYVPIRNSHVHVGVRRLVIVSQSMLYGNLLSSYWHGCSIICHRLVCTAHLICLLPKRSLCYCLFNTFICRLITTVHIGSKTTILVSWHVTCA